MFGYEQGAFTGAERRKRGKFEQASGGLLFLDEIGDMSLPLQAKLLHVLQGGDFSPLGSEKNVKMAAWIITATNRELEGDMENGKFREDLYYRLNTITITIEPLRKRPEDIPYLIEYYLKKYNLKFNGKQPEPLSQNTVDRLTYYHWPGNVRELQNVLRRLMVLGYDESNLDDILGSIERSHSAKDSLASAPSPLKFTKNLAVDAVDISDLSSLSLKKVRKKAKNQVDKIVIEHTLKKTCWNRKATSKILDISYRSLLYRLEELNVTPHHC
jgi:transcriptional regulator with PAS, ATPase and Fis domain